MGSDRVEVEVLVTLQRQEAVVWVQDNSEDGKINVLCLLSLPLVLVILPPREVNG